MAICKQCHTWFHREPGEHWKHYCLSCWIEFKNAEQECNRCTALERQVARLESQVEAARECLTFVLGGFRQFWPFLLRRAHPDQNGGSKEATDATRWLLELRDFQKQLPGGVDGAHRVRN